MIDQGAAPLTGFALTHGYVAPYDTRLRLVSNPKFEDFYD